ncbi:hypothetical protein PIB30_059791 [Stylosanthes scabra]|uniref:F-box domain-containing protein n=1 Tax=Stylosanthes scabra TaxID=79078 RepID=A0ABU6UJ53_9FABA|nr:hypothetical protein [Stylosanthes scabra]
MSVDASDLPHDLLSVVADDLGLIDLLRFRAVCKDWRSASTWSTALVESMDDNPWLLIYGHTSSLCLLKEGSRKDMIYTLKLHELNGSTCIASDHGWLLLFNKGSMFFFCPFSKARIDLPNFLVSDLPEGCVAAFSSDPTSQDCVVVVAMKNKSKGSSMLELRVLFRGEHKWRVYGYGMCSGELDLAIYHLGVFHIFHDSFNLITFIFINRKIRWQSYNLVNYVGGDKYEAPKLWLGDKKPVNYILNRDQIDHVILTMPLEEKLGLDSSALSISICGTKFAIQNKPSHVCGIIFSEKRIYEEDEDDDHENEEHARKCQIYHLKGVWFQPRYFQISPHQTW